MIESVQHIRQHQVQRNLANQAEMQHLQGDIEKTCIEAEYDEHVASYDAGMLETKIAKLGSPSLV